MSTKGKRKITLAAIFVAHILYKIKKQEVIIKMTIGGVISNITHFLVLISFWKWVLLFQNDFFFSFSELVNEELFF